MISAFCRRIEKGKNTVTLQQTYEDGGGGGTIFFFFFSIDKGQAFLQTLKSIKKVIVKNGVSNQTEEFNGEKTRAENGMIRFSRQCRKFLCKRIIDV